MDAKFDQGANEAARVGSESTQDAGLRFVVAVVGALIALGGIALTIFSVRGIKPGSSLVKLSLARKGAIIGFIIFLVGAYLSVASCGPMMELLRLEP